MSCPESSSGGIIHHVALLPSSGMGHLTPFLRLAGSLVAAGIHVTFISTHPTVSEAESQALSTFFNGRGGGGGMITQKQLHLIQLPAAGIDDPFYHHMEIIRRSCSQLLPPLLTSSSSPLSAIIIDMSLTTTILPLTRSLSLPSFVFFTSSAKMLTLFSTSHQIFTSKFLEDKPDLIMIPGQDPIPTSWLPPAFFKGKSNVLRDYLMENGKKLVETDGILINTMQDLEDGALSVLNDGRVVKGLPIVVPIGPLVDLQVEPEAEGNYNNPYPWLDDQPSGSVLFVSFGSRTAMSREQTRELGLGLMKSGFGFVWAVKDKKVDREDEVNLREVIGEELLERLRGRGLVLKEWVKQSAVLQHKAVGGFMSHCGWNSIVESVTHGVPMLAWPQHGDQRINASLVETSGIGIWDRTWDWPTDTTLVTQHQIADSITALMTNQGLRSNIKAFSTAAVGTRGIAQLIDKLLLTKK